MVNKIQKVVILMLTCLILTFSLSYASAVNMPGPISWGNPVTINNIPNFSDAGPDARGEYPGKYGSQYPRMAKLSDGSWLCVYTIYDNNGYLYADSHGETWKGNALQIAKSTDNCRTWTVISTLRDNNRDLDNGMIIQLPNGQLRMTARSIRWQESYRIYVWSSVDGGVTWQWLSSVDSNEGAPGSLGNPDKGVYEPHFVLLDNGNLAVMYANEKHVTANPSYSQIISEKISTDNGATWGNEIWVAWDTSNSASRPGMPVWTKMSNGKYIVTFEVIATHGGDIYYKISDDGVTWTSGIGNRIPYQTGAPYVLSLSDGRLLVTSNTHEISISADSGNSWFLDDIAPWGSLQYADNLWPCLYQTGPNEIAALTSAGRTQPVGNLPTKRTEGHNIQIKFGSFSTVSTDIVSGAYYKLVNQNSFKCLDVTAGSMDNFALIEQWDDNGLAPEQWRFDDIGGGYYKITNRQSGKCLDLPNGLGTDGVQLQQYTDIGADAQRWKVEYIGSGNFKITNKQSGKTVEVNAASFTSGEKVQQYTDNSGKCQRWKLVRVN